MAKAKKLPSGSWRTLEYAGRGADGRRRYESFTAPTKAEAELAAAEFAVSRKRKSVPGNMTVGEAIDRYIDSKANVLSPTTITTYRYERKTSLQQLMPVSLGDLTQELVQRAVNEDAKTRASKTVRNSHGFLSAVLAEYLPDFSLRTTLPQKTKPDIDVPGDESVKLLIENARGREIETAVTLAAGLGLRRSEICALLWSDVDLKAGTVAVSKAMVKNEEKQWVIKPPKTYAGSRVISAPDFVMKQLASLNRNPDGRVIALHPDGVTDKFDALKKQCGIKYRFHDLRHYNASVMLALGVPDKYAMERMGHATTNMLKAVYQHTMQRQQEAVSESINNYFKSTMQHEMQHEPQ